MASMYRDRAHCSRSGEGIPAGLDACANTACDRFVTETVARLADEAKMPIGYADLRTSKCGFVPREGE